MKQFQILIAGAVLSLLSLPIVAQQRKVLVEQFTNGGCPPCASNTPLVASYVNTNLSTVLMLAYHTSFPYFDSMYHENAAQSDQRVAYYSIGAVPLSKVDGNAFTGNLVPVLPTVIPARAMVQPRYEISFISSNQNNSTITASLQLESTDAANQNENLVVQIVVAEKNVLKSSYICCAGANTETEYPWVVRRMLPDANGTLLVNKSIGGVDNISVSWNAGNIKDNNEVRLIAFVQNNTTKEIYQTEISLPMLTTGISENQKEKSFSVSNPVINGEFHLQFNQAVNKGQLSIIDVLGNKVYAQALNSQTGEYIFTKELAPGIYFIGWSSEGSRQFEKIVIK